MSVYEILQGYSKRVNTIGSYYFLVSSFINRNKFKNYTNEEFFNITMQFLCFIFEKSIKRENCLVQDLKEFLMELDVLVYKKGLREEEINELVSYFIKGLTNEGKAYNFEYYNFAEKINQEQNIRLIKSDIVQKEGLTYLSYSLTEQCYKIILGSKEYDEMFSIKVSQIIAKIRIENGDFKGAKTDIQDIIDILRIQSQNMFNYFKAVRGNINYLKESNFIPVLEQSINTLNDEMNKYDELKEDITNLIIDKENMEANELRFKSKKDIEKLVTQISLLKDLIYLIGEAKREAANLLTDTQNYRLEFKEVLNKLLINKTISKFSFKDVIALKLERSEVNLDNLAAIYSSLFMPRLNIPFGIDTAYEDQKIMIKKDNINIEVDDYEDIDYSKQIEEQMIKDKNEDYYFLVVKSLLNYGLKYEEFTLKEFLNYYISTNQGLYIEITKNSYLFRDALLNLIDIEDISLKAILIDLERINFTQTKEMQIERIIERMINEDNNFVHLFENMKIINNLEEINVKTNINIEDMTSEIITIPNIKFKVD